MVVPKRLFDLLSNSWKAGYTFLAVRNCSSCYYIRVHVFPYNLSSSSLFMVICLEFSIHSMCYSLFAVICLALPPIMNKHMMFICYA